MEINKEHIEILNRIIKEIPEHQTLLSFGGDTENVMFQYWWTTEGRKSFIDWAALQDEGDF